MLTMSYFSLLVNYYLYYYINHSRFWPILSRDLLRNKILQKRINNEKVTLLFTGVQIIKSNSIKLDFWSTPKGRFSMCWYIGACIETCRRRKHIPTLWCDLRPRLLWQAWIIAYHQDSHGFREIQQEDYLWKFVWICGWLFRTRISTNIFFCWIRAIIFVESCWICVGVLFVEGGVMVVGQLPYSKSFCNFAGEI